MTYELRYSQRAEKELSKLGKNQSRLIAAWLKKNISGCENPRSLGGPLSANHKGKWRYRVGSYRVLVTILDDELVVLAIRIGHRREVYKGSL